MTTIARRGATVGLLTLPFLAAMSTLVACGNPGKPTTVADMPAPSTTAPASTPAYIAAGTLKSSITYSQGELRFDPPPSGATPSISAAAAYSSFLATGVYSYATKYATPTIQLASYTNYGSGTANASGSIALTQANELVWLLRFTGVPDTASGGGSVSGGSSDQTPLTVTHDILAVVDAQSGKAVDVISSLPDSVPYPPPQSG